MTKVDQQRRRRRNAHTTGRISKSRSATVVRSTKKGDVVIDNNDGRTVWKADGSERRYSPDTVEAIQRSLSQRNIQMPPISLKVSQLLAPLEHNCPAEQMKALRENVEEDDNILHSEKGHVSIRRQGVHAEIRISRTGHRTEIHDDDGRITGKTTLGSDYTKYDDGSVRIVNKDGRIIERPAIRRQKSQSQSHHMKRGSSDDNAAESMLGNRKRARSFHDQARESNKKVRAGLNRNVAKSTRTVKAVESSQAGGDQTSGTNVKPARRKRKKSVQRRVKNFLQRCKKSFKPFPKT